MLKNIFYLFIYLLFIQPDFNIFIWVWSHWENKETESHFIARHLQVIAKFEYRNAHAYEKIARLVITAY